MPKLTPGGQMILITSYRPPPKDLPKLSSIISMWQMEHEVLMKSVKHKGIINIIDTKHFGIAAAAQFMTEMKTLFDLVTVIIGVLLVVKHLSLIHISEPTRPY